MAMYHLGNRELQDQFGSRALADRLADKLWRDRFKNSDKIFIESVGFFFLATANREGEPDCSFKGGAPGFVQVPAPDLLVFPDYDGNGMFKSRGNIRVTPSVGLLFMTLNDKPQRLRVNGRATIVADDPLVTRSAGCQLMVRSRRRTSFPIARTTFLTCRGARRHPTSPARKRRRRSRPGRASRISRTWCRRGGRDFSVGWVELFAEPINDRRGWNPPSERASRPGVGRTRGSARPILSDAMAAPTQPTVPYRDLLRPRATSGPNSESRRRSRESRPNRHDPS